MKSLNIPVLFLSTLIIQIIFYYLFLGKESPLKFFTIALVCSIVSTLLSYSMLYYIGKNKDEYSQKTEIKIGLTTFHFILINLFIFFVFSLLQESINYLILINSLVLTMYGRQIVNKEINELIS